MSSLNQVSLIGRVGADPEIKTTGSGLKIANLRLATSETWRDKQSGEKKEATQWHTIVCFNENLSKIIEQYVKKGSQIFVQGQLEHRSWEKPDGGKGYASEVALRFDSKVTLLGSGSGGGGGGRDYDKEQAERGQTKSSSQPSQGSFGGSPGRASSHLDDDIPFAPEWR